MTADPSGAKTRDLSDAEFQRAIALSGQDRYALFVEQVANSQQIWSLRTRSGWVTMGQDTSSGPIVPVWHHSRFAEPLIGGDWADAEVTGITLRDWVDRWLPGMIKQGTKIAVFPVLATLQGVVVVPPERLQWDLQQAAERYE
jgi:hypothetical protein